MAQKPSVIFINRVYPPMRGATGRVLRDLAHAFVKDGWNVTVLTTGPVAGEEKDGAVSVIRIGQKKDVRSALDYAAIWCRLILCGLRQPRHDLVVTLTDPPLIVVGGRLIAKIKQSRHIHWCHDLYPDLLPALGVRCPDFMVDWLQGLSRRAMKKCDRVVTIGRCMARQLTGSGLDPKKIAVIPNWPDRELAEKPVLTAKSGFRHASDQTSRHVSAPIAINPVSGEAPHADGEAMPDMRPFEDLLRDGDHPKFRVLYAGNLGRAHPVDTILDAATILARDYPDIEIVFVGGGAGQDSLLRERTARGLENIRFLPYQPVKRLRALMESGDVHLVTMADEAAGFLVPSKLYAALAVRRPCIFIGPSYCETARVITDFKAGAVIPHGEAEMLVQVITAYRHHPDTWFAAHEGSAQAGRIFVPDEAIAAWIRRARDTAGLSGR